MTQDPQTRAYSRPTSLEEAVSRLADGARILAGGTDFYPALRDADASGAVVDLSGVAALKGVTRTEEGWRIGAGATWTDMIRAALPPAFDGLKAAGREVGSVQIQNIATVAGNICNASPAADGAPALLSLLAEVEIVGPSGARRLPLDEFILGPRQTALAPNELVAAILIPPHEPTARSSFVKLGARTYLVISIAMVAAVLQPDAEGKVAFARVAVGACSAKALRLLALEQALVGAPMEAQSLAGVANEAHLAPLSPIDDVRASAGYRREAALELVKRALAECCDQETGAAA